jgi:hypothetical protein
MRGRTVIFAALAILFAVAALVYGVLHSPPGPNQAAERGQNSEATRAGAAERSGLPPNARNEAPGEPRSGAPLRDSTGTVGAAPGTPGTARPSGGTPPGGAGR